MTDRVKRVKKHVRVPLIDVLHLGTGVGVRLLRGFVPANASLTTARKFVRMRWFVLLSQSRADIAWSVAQKTAPLLPSLHRRRICPPSGIWNRNTRLLCGNPAFCPYCYYRRAYALYMRIVAQADRFAGVIILERKVWFQSVNKEKISRLRLDLAKEMAAKIRKLCEKSLGFASVVVVYPCDGGYELRMTRFEVLAKGYPATYKLTTSMFVDLRVPEGLGVLEMTMLDTLAFPPSLLYPPQPPLLFALWAEARAKRWLPVLVGGGILSHNDSYQPAGGMVRQALSSTRELANGDRVSNRRPTSTTGRTGIDSGFNRADAQHSRK